MSYFYVVSTPIGNLEDITYRAIRILSEVDIILCEDTRVTQKLLHHYGIQTKTESYNAHASLAKELSIHERIQKGTTFALVSDAGTPTISDPGVKLIEYIRSRMPEVCIVPIPGVSALITALSVTGFSGNQFTFFGFIPHKKGRESIFKEILSSDRVGIFYESPHRIMKTLEYLSKQNTTATLAIGRELTKLHEQIITGSTQELYQYFLENPDKVRGEFVVLISK